MARNPLPGKGEYLALVSPSLTSGKSDVLEIVSLDRRNYFSRLLVGIYLPFLTV